MVLTAYDVIKKKRDSLPLTEEEIRFLVNGYVSGEVADYQMAAFLMAVFLNGMNEDEILWLTRVMRDSGDIVDLSDIVGIKVDKHSTGGVGDKTTLIVGPIAAAAGAIVAKMSGRALGHTGGTLDKLESIPGFRVELSREEFVEQVEEVGIAVIGQTANIAPADKKIYALRDVTATIESIPLIASSIMSKKLASGADRFVFDVKVGRGAFMQDIEDARELAYYMVKIADMEGKKAVALLTNMDEPLGWAVGNSLEVMDAIDTLKGKGEPHFTDKCLELASWMIYLANEAESIDEAREKAREKLESGEALDKLREMIERQGGDPRVVEDYSLLPKGEKVYEFKASRDGYISAIDALKVGRAVMLLGAGRQKKEDEIDYGVGAWFERKVGDEVKKGDVIFKLYYNDENKLKKALEELAASVVIFPEKIEREKMILDIVEN